MSVAQLARSAICQLTSDLRIGCFFTSSDIDDVDEGIGLVESLEEGCRQVCVNSPFAPEVIRVSADVQDWDGCVSAKSHESGERNVELQACITMRVVSPSCNPNIFFSAFTSISPASHPPLRPCIMRSG